MIKEQYVQEDDFELQVLQMPKQSMWLFGETMHSRIVHQAMNS